MHSPSRADRSVNSECPRSRLNLSKRRNASGRFVLGRQLSGIPPCFFATCCRSLYRRCLGGAARWRLLVTFLK